jgi:cytochrome c6
MKRLLIVLLISTITLALFGFSVTPILAADIDNGAKIFTVNCVGCHPHGGNIVRRGKTLTKKALHKNKFDSLPTVVSIVTNGKNNMSAYGDRLSQQEIEDVAAYVLAEAESGWR